MVRRWGLSPGDSHRSVPLGAPRWYCRPSRSSSHVAKKAKGNWKRKTSDKELGVCMAFPDPEAHSPRTAPRRTCSCPPYSTTPTVAGPFCLLPSQRQKILSSGRRSGRPLQGQQGPPQAHFRMTIHHHQLLWEKELYSDQCQKAGEAWEGPIAWGSICGPTPRSSITGYSGTAPATYCVPNDTILAWPVTLSYVFREKKGERTFR